MLLQKNIFRIKNPEEFKELALSLFKIQAANVPVYNKFISYLKIDPDNVKSLEDIPFLPAGLFKSNKIIHKEFDAELIFESSGTTDTTNSRHYIPFPGLYEESFLTCFKYFYGNPADYTILALLPSYLERKNSSLIYMVNKLIKETSKKDSGFYLYNLNELLKKISTLKNKKGKVLLIGVSFALLELAEKYSPDLSGIIVMETGGMKGKRKEITREELHSTLKSKCNIENIHSEYGMTELLSQAYSKKNGIFNSPSWMKIMIRDPYDPGTILKKGKTGAVNIIDLANMYSCAFIATSDLGKVIPDEGFEIIGRMDNSDLRGCNLLAF